MHLMTDRRLEQFADSPLVTMALLEDGVPGLPVR